MTKAQKTFWHHLDKAVNSEIAVSFELFDHSEETSEIIIIADNGRSPDSATPGKHTIDVGDIAILGEGGLITSSMVLIHEISEGFQLQAKGRDPGYAHKYGNSVEKGMAGITEKQNYATVDYDTGITSVTIYATVNSIKREIIFLFRNGNLHSINDILKNEK
jgi:hypothetical protein